MASLMPSSDAEILVHVTAPSRASDDIAYRQLANAYLAFQPQTHIQIIGAESRVDAPSPEPDKAPSGNAFASQSFTQSFDINSQDISFSGALDNRLSPRLPCTLAPAAQDEAITLCLESRIASQVSWCAPPSQISDSYPMPDQSLLHISPSRVLKRYIGSSDTRSGLPASSPPSPSHQRNSVPSIDQGVADVPSSLPEPENQELPRIQALGHLKANQTIPVTPYLSKTTRAPQSSIDSAVLVADESILDTIYISSSAPTDQEPTPSYCAESEPPLTKRPTVTHLRHADLVRSSSDTGPTSSSGKFVAEEIGRSLEIRPPSPPVGVIDVDPKDFISEKMAKLAQDLSSRYRPETKREVDPFERGYWLLNCTSWNPEDRFNAWVFLNNYIRNGLAGWGTWCRRGNDHQWIRLYCWGHVAKHMYLLLYTASKRLLKNTGASWYGADGEVVLEVLPNDKQRLLLSSMPGA